MFGCAFLLSASDPSSRRGKTRARRLLSRSCRQGKARSALGSGLRNLVSILDASELVLAPDTGPLHIAVALGRPVISLMGYTDPRRTGPYRRFHDLLIDAFHEPGETQGPVTMETKRDRMQRISVDDVSNKIETWAQLYRGKS